MKKLISLFLVLTLFAGILPVEVLAVEDTFTLPQEEYRKVVRKAGMSDSTWHEGMTWSDSMSSYQKFCYLTDLRDDVVTPVKNRYLQAEKTAAGDGGVPAEASGYSLSEINKTLFTLESGLNYFIFDLENEINAVANAEITVEDGKASEDDKAKAYRRIQKAEKRLAELDAELKSGSFPDSWQQKADAANAQLDVFFDAVTAAETKTAPTMRTLVGANEAKAINGAGEVSFNIIILDTDQIGFEVRTKDLKAIANAKVTVKYGSTERTGYTGTNGVVIFPAGAFSLDRHNRMDAAVRIEKSGYRTWESQRIRITAGEGVQAQLEEDTGESYVQYVTFRGVDVAHDSEHVYYTPANDAKQSFTVGVHTYPGSTCTFSMSYTPAGSESRKTVTRTVTGTKDEVVKVDLSDTWCAKLAPKEPVTMQCTTGSSGTTTFDRKTGVTVEKAIVEKPLKSISGAPGFVPGTSFSVDIPLGLPGLKSMKMSMSIPWELLGVPSLSFGVTINGDFYLSIAVAQMNKIVNGAVADEWKLYDSQKATDQFNDFLEGRKTLTEIAKANTQKDGTKKPLGKVFNTGLTASYCLMLNGQVTKQDNAGRDEDPYKGSMDLFVSAAMDAIISFKSQFTVGPVPCYVGFDLTLGIQAAVDLPFTFTADASGIGAFSNWHNVAFDKNYFDIIISPRASIGAYVGAGVKGLAGIYIRGFVGMSINLHLLPFQDEKFKAEVILSASLQVVAEFLLWSAKATIWEKSWRSNTDRSSPAPDGEIRLTAGKNANEDDQIHYTEAEVTALTMIDGMTGYKTVQAGKDFYAFWIEEQEIEGVMRPWLSAAKLEKKNGRQTLTPMDLPDLYILSYSENWNVPRKINQAIKVIDFDVTSTNELAKHEGGFDMITLAVTFEVARTVREGGGKHLEITDYTTDFYSIIFHNSGAVWYYAVQADSYYENSLDPVLTGTQVSINYVRQDVTDKGETAYNYSMVCTTTFDNAPTKVHVGEKEIGFIPKKNGNNRYQMSYHEVSGTHKQLDFNSTADPIDELMQITPVARGYGRGNKSLVFALANLKGTENEYGIKKNVFLVKDASGTISKKILSGDIACFRYIAGFGSSAGLIALPVTPNESGRYSLVLTDYTVDSAGNPTFTTPRDLGVRVSPACFDLVDLGASRALYYLESVTETAGYDTDQGYSIRAVYLGQGSDGKIVSTSSFHLATFKNQDVNPGAGIGFMKLYTDSSGFVQGMLAEKIKVGEQVLERNADNTLVKYTDARYMNLKYFTFRQTLQAEVLNAVPEQTLVRPGDTVNVLFTVMNTGNIPAGKVTMLAYAQKKGVSGRTNLAEIVVDCTNPDNSKVSQRGMPDLTGREAVSQYDIVEGESKDTFLISENGLNSVIATSALMPDETHAYRACFHVPSDFTPGDYQIFVTFSKISTKVMLQAGRYDAVSAWAKTLVNEDSPSAKNDAKSAASDEVTTLTMTFREPMRSDGSDGDDGNDRFMYATYALENSQGQVTGRVSSEQVSAFALSATNDRNEIPLEDADLSVTGRLTCEAGTEMVHVVIRNEGMAPATDIVFTAYVDDDKTFSYALSGVTLAYQQSLSFDIPLSEITGGKEGENLILKVGGDSVETNLYNNEDVLPLNLSFMIIRHPADVFIKEGQNAEFSVKARGGKEPYHYQWQVSTSGQYGPFRNIDGATDQILKLTDVPYKNNGCYYRVVVTDAEGRVLTSNPALLVVTKVPVTGDSGNPWLWLGLLVAVLPVMAALTRKKKRC